MPICPEPSTRSDTAMKETPYSRILLILSGTLLGIAAVLVYAAAIRVFPIYSFLSQKASPSLSDALAPLTVPMLALTASFLLLACMYKLFPPHVCALVILSALLLPLGRLYCARYDADSARYLFPAFIFFLYPITGYSLVRRLFPRVSFRGASLLALAPEALTGLCLLSLFAVLLSGHVLILNLLALFFAPFLPLLIALHLCLSHFARQYRASTVSGLLLLASMLPLSSALRPFTYDLSMTVVRLGVPTFLLFFLVTGLLFFQRRRKEKKPASSIPVSSDDPERKE